MEYGKDVQICIAKGREHIDITLPYYPNLVLGQRICVTDETKILEGYIQSITTRINLFVYMYVQLFD